jgi:hypothetical protein
MHVAIYNRATGSYRSLLELFRMCEWKASAREVFLVIITDGIGSFSQVILRGRASVEKFGL